METKKIGGKMNKKRVLSDDKGDSYSSILEYCYNRRGISYFAGCSRGLAYLN